MSRSLISYEGFLTLFATNTGVIVSLIIFTILLCMHVLVARVFNIVLVAKRFAVKKGIIRILFTTTNTRVIICCRIFTICGSTKICTIRILFSISMSQRRAKLSRVLETYFSAYCTRTIINCRIMTICRPLQILLFSNNRAILMFMTTRNRTA